MATPKILTGARAIFRIDGKPIAFSNNVSARVGYPHLPVNVLGRYSAARYEPVGLDVTVNAGTLRFTGPGGTGNAADGPLGIAPLVQQMMDKEDMVIELLDRQTGETALLVTQARLTDRSINIGARDLFTEAWSFVGIIATNSDAGAQDEGGGVLPPNTEAAN